MGESYSALSFGSGMGCQPKSRPITGHLLSIRRRSGRKLARRPCWHRRNARAPGRLFFSSSGTSAKAVAGTTEIDAQDLASSRAGLRPQARSGVYLDAEPEPEISAQFATDLEDQTQVTH